MDGWMDGWMIVGDRGVGEERKMMSGELGKWE